LRGLGLSFSKRIMTVYHKGDIRVENSKNRKGGTTFELKLPIG
jgi:signal transduction histidine kinase